MIQTEIKDEFPESIEGFGYHFNEEGQLRDIKTNERFEFYVKPDDNSYNQTRYERLGEAIGEYIENELVTNEDALECQNLLLIIQGSGVVRPGQWARRVIINDCLELGTMYPYIQKAQELNWGIIVFNPNENYRAIIKDGEVIKRESVRGSESPQKHCIYVWNNFVTKAKAEKILVMGYSFGGINITCLMDEF
ncbi:14967_t:CDS:2, partial [Dentiscutata erythropus]